MPASALRRQFFSVMKMKILVWTVVSVFVVVVVAAVAWWALRPQVLTFDDGSTLTLMGADYGIHHVSPTTKRAFNTATNALVVWIRLKHDPNQWANYQYFLYDMKGEACVSGMQSYGGNSRRGNDVLGVQFPAFPRRARKFYVRAQEFGNGGQEMSDDKFVISNPARGAKLGWTPTPLPDTEQDGDMSVTLKKLVAGVKTPYNRDGDDPDDAINKGVQATFNVQINGTNASMWQPVAIQTSDATGNQVDGWVNPQQMQQPEGGDSVFTYQYGLWPDEPAWKLHVEFSKQSDFDSSELWSIQGIPLDAGRQQDFWNYGGRRQNGTNVFAEADVGGLHLKIFRAKVFSDMPPNSNPQGGLTIEVDPSLPEGTRMTLVKLTDDQANDINHWDYGNNRPNQRGGTIYRYGLQNVEGSTNLNLTLAIHKSHFLDFTAKPEAAPPDTTDQANQ